MTGKVCMVRILSGAEVPMEATVAERGQITLPKAVRDALGLTKGTTLKVELDGGENHPAQGCQRTLRKIAWQVQAGRRF